MTELIPKGILFGNPVKSKPEISPDGKQIAYLAPVDNVLNIWIKTIGLEDDRVITKEKYRGIITYFWAYDMKHMIYLQDTGGNENWNLYSVDLKTGGIKNLTPFPEVQVRIIKHERHFPDEILIGMNKEDRKKHDIYRLHINSGELELVAENSGNAARWLSDADLNIRAAISRKPDGVSDLLIRKNKNSPWEFLCTWDLEDSMNCKPVCFSKDGQYIYLIDSRDANAARLVKIEIATGTREIIAEDPRYDVIFTMIEPDSYEIQAVAFYKDRIEWLILDETIKDDFEAVGKLDRGDINIKRNNNDTAWIVSFSGDTNPGRHYIYDRRTKKGEFIFSEHPELNNYTLADTEPVSFTSRDGLTIHGYLTFPPGKERKNLPLVLRVHGGPWSRDIWVFTPEVQLFANRGYACLQINYRGSASYGKDFLNASNREWGGKMLDDLVDGVKWTVDRNIADPKKIAIFGRSYGGYAALTGATFAPDLFCCAVDVYGISNLITFMNTIPPYWITENKALFVKRIGDPETEEEFLKSRSPFFYVDRIKIPLLIIQGANDPRVKRSESEQIVEALKNKGIEHEYILFPDEGHSIVRPENRMKFYSAAEKFLAKHLGGRFEE